MSSNPSQPTFAVTQGANYRETYANSVQVRVSVWDIFLLFGLAHPTSPDDVVIENQQGIYLSPQQAKALFNILGQRPGVADHLRGPGLLCLLFLLEVAAHATLLHLPYWWDEAGYYIPAAYDFFRTGSPVPFSTLTNAHPPGLSLYLAAAWKLFGFAPITTRVAMCLAAATALLAVYSLGLRALGSRPAAAAVVLLTACYPVWFAQSTLAHADTLAAAFTLWGLRLAFFPDERPQTNLKIALCFSAAALTKEIAIGTPLALVLVEFATGWRAHGRRIAALCAPVAPLALWFGYHRLRTGFTFGNPEYLRYNAATTHEPVRILLALAHRAVHLSLHLNLFVPVFIALGSLVLPALASRPAPGRALWLRVWAVIVANALLFSVLGGALLTRYLLPVYPLVLLLVVAAIWRRFRHWLWFPALSAFAFVAALVMPPPYRVAPEDTLAYRDAILLQQSAIDVVEQRFPHSTVLTAWPVTDDLRKPELGYTARRMQVEPVDNFSEPVIAALAHTLSSYETAIVFSTKYEPAQLPFALGRWNEREDERWFDLHHDLDADTVARMLGGTVVWHAERGGQWAAVLRFQHPQLAYNLW